MDLETYRLRKLQLKEQVPQARRLCWTCRQVYFGCYCESVKPFDSNVHFVILIHPIEVKRRVATGRMAHLCIRNSTLIEGKDFSDNNQVRAIIKDANNHCVILYPGFRSTNLSRISPDERASLTPEGKRLVIFVIDGTWNTAGRMMRSDGIRDLPRVAFDPTQPSRFRVRKQPAAHYLSTIEAIHHTIELLGDSKQYAMNGREHDNLLEVFDHMVEFQLRFTNSQK